MTAQVLRESTLSNGQGNRHVVYTLGHDVIGQWWDGFIQPFQEQPAQSLSFSHDIVSAGVATYITDGHGSTRALLVASRQDGQLIGSLRQRYTYDAYGNALGFDPLFAATTHLYSGEQFDAQIQRQFLRARWYDATTGRFQSLDPFAGNSTNPLSFHKYLYTHADPINGIDPTGWFTVTASLGASSLAAGLANTIGGVGLQTMETTNQLGDAQSRDQAVQSLVGATVVGVIVAANGPLLDLAMRGLNYLRKAFFLGEVVPGYIKVGSSVVAPGTMIGGTFRPRLIPGTPGFITGGSSTVLRKNILNANKVRFGSADSLPGFQAHHIIPSQLGDERLPILMRIGIDLDSATNGIMLPNALHTGRHPDYTDALRQRLNEIPLNQSDEALCEAVYLIQAKVANAFAENRVSLRGPNTTTANQWLEILA